uniref:pyroglutamyl-peptidase 1-like n=1 Tax=Styela clava TaxID=7725 RepID=UPI001939B512|nr:pyroglutamyl-peptidase 1-like [Styela clava]
MAPPFKVVVTGFGPFRDHKVNASWVTVQKMKETGGLGSDIELEIVHIEVEYGTVDQVVPKLWKQHKPQLMVHVGVSGRAKSITLEECAKNTTYATQDNSGKCPRNGCCKKSGDSCLKSSLDMKKIAEEAKKINPDIEIETSKEAGRYLCEYIYYTSLHLKKGASAFVHVPPLNRKYTEGELATGLRTVITLMIDQIRSR